MTAPAREAERLGELLKAATPLPWDYVQAAPHRLCHVETSCENPHGAGLPVCSIPAKRECDAALIVAAVNALPGLLAERAALVEALGKVRSALSVVNDVHFVNHPPPLIATAVLVAGSIRVIDDALVGGQADGPV